MAKIASAARAPRTRPVRSAPAAARGRGGGVSPAESLNGGGSGGRVRGREFAEGQFPPDRYLLVEMRLFGGKPPKGKSLADWLLERRKGPSPVPYATLAHDLMNRTKVHLTNETIRKWVNHLTKWPGAVRSYHDVAA